MDRLPQLLAILEGDLTLRWEKIRKTHIIDEIEAFSKEIRELGAEYHSEVLKNWGSNLFDALQTFDMKKVGKILEDFPGIIRGCQEKDDQ